MAAFTRHQWDAAAPVERVGARLPAERQRVLMSYGREARLARAAAALHRLDPDRAAARPVAARRRGPIRSSAQRAFCLGVRAASRPPSEGPRLRRARGARAPPARRAILRIGDDIGLR
jgi:hypothetical protein